MTEHKTHHDKEFEVVEHYKEEGAITHEDLNVVEHDAIHKKHHNKNFALTTPVAIIIASVILSGGIMGYGFITTNGTTSSTSNPLPKILKELKINKKAFTTCVNSGEMTASVTSEINDASTNAGVNGTPTTFIIREENGVQYIASTVSGAQTEDFFKQAIDSALSLTSVNKLPVFKGKAITSEDIQEVTTPSKVYVLEYSDAECPFCIRLHDTMKKIRTDYAGKISFVYRNFPLTQIHQHAQKEAEMITCAGKIGGAEAMYGFIDKVFDYKIKNNVGYITLDAQ